MKRLISALLCIVMLAGLFGCKPANQPPVDPTPPQTESPSPSPTTTVEPTAEPTVEPSPSPTVSPTVPPEEEPELVYSNEELGVEIYTLEKGARTIVCYGELSQEIADFPYNVMRPEPEIWEHDGDGDGTKELYIIHEWGSGTGVSVSRLLVCEQNGDKLDYWVHDWKPVAEEFSENSSVAYCESDGLITVGYNGKVLSVRADPTDAYTDLALVDDNHVYYYRDLDNTVCMVLFLSIASEHYPIPNAYGIIVAVKLAFDGNAITPVIPAQLGYSGMFMAAASPSESARLWDTRGNGPVLECGNVGGPIIVPNDFDDPLFHQDNLSQITLYDPDPGEEQPVVLISAPNADGLELFYTLRWNQGGTWDLSHFCASFAPAAHRLTVFDHLLHSGAPENWYLTAIGSIYENPADMDLGLVFYGGFNPGDPGWGSFTPEEEAYLLSNGFVRSMSAQKMPAARLDEVLNTYFGISLYDAAIPADWVYYPETDSYYSNHNDAYRVHGFTLMDVVETDDGLIELHYYVEPYQGAFDPATGWPVVYGILTLRANNDNPDGREGYTVVSNRSAQPIDALDEEGVYLYALPDGRLFLQDGDIAGPVTYVNDINANHPGYYDLSQITITRKDLLHDWEGEPLYNVILLNVPFGDGASENPELWWVEESGTWEQAPFQSPGPLGNLMGEVTKDTVPTDPKQFYLVAESSPFALYARNWGTQALLTWEGNFWWYLGDRTSHTARFDLPVMTLINDTTAAVVSEVSSGSQLSPHELVVYQIVDIQSEDGSWYMGMRDHVYDWRPAAEEFNRNNTVVYDKESDSLVLYWSDEVHFTGALPHDLSDLLGLEDGFTGALFADGNLLNFTANDDGSFTATTWTCIGNGGEDAENNYYPLPMGNSGFRLSWTVRFTGEGFETSDMTVTQVDGETVHLRAALPREEIYLFRSVGMDGKNYLLVDRQISVLESNQSFGDLITDFRLCDLDGDGEDEIAVVGNLYAGAGYTSILNVLDKTADGWTVHQFFRDIADYDLIGTAVFSSAGTPNHVILSLEGFQFMFSVSDEVAARDGDYSASSVYLNTVITWDGDGYYLHLPGAVYRDDSSFHPYTTAEQSVGVQFELLCKLEYDGSGTITRTPIGITPPYTHFTVTQREENLFELVSEQGIVRFEGTHLPGEEIVTYNRDLDFDGVEDFIVLLVSDRSDTSLHQDAYIFDGRTLEQVDTSDLWSIAQSLFVFIGDSEMFHIHCGTFRQPLYKKDILARYPDIEYLDKVEFWGERSSISVMYDYIEVRYDCIVGQNGESYGALNVCLVVENGELVPCWIEYVSVDGQYKTYNLAPRPVPGPFIGE